VNGELLPVSHCLSEICPASEPAAEAINRWRGQDQIDFDTEFFARVLLKNASSTDILRIVGELLSHRGHHESALAIDQRLAQLCPRDCVVHYNLACSLALLGDQRAAIKELRRAFKYGYADLAYMERDPDLASIRRNSAYKTLVDEFTAASGEFYLELEDV
jgi:tetratricopeptide (TPR) repeat protein